MFVQRANNRITGYTRYPHPEYQEQIKDDDPELLAYKKEQEDRQNGVLTKAEKDQNIDNLFTDPRLGTVLDAIIEAAGLNKGQIIAAAKSKV